MAPQLEKRGFRGTFWIVGADIGKDTLDYPHMTWEQVASLSKRGHEVSNHSWTHPNLTELPVCQIKREIEQCDSAIYAATGKRPLTFCYPFNAFNEEVLALCTERRVGTRTSWEPQGQEVSGCTDESLELWLDTLIDSGAWGVTMTHALDYGWDKWDDPQVLWRFYDRVKAREAEVWVGTFEEVSAYLREYECTTLEVEKTDDGLVISPKMTLDASLFTEPLTLRIIGDFTSVAVTATQDGKSLEVTNRGDNLLLNFNPSGAPLKLVFAGTKAEEI